MNYKNIKINKKVILLASIVVLLISCNETKKEETIIETKVIEAQTENKTSDKNQQLNNEWTQIIELNNSDKWDANIETTTGVKNMLLIINKSDPSTVQDYLDLANNLNTEKNTLVKECTMTGPPHDNLHIFLHPLIEKINMLLKTETIEDGFKITASIQENLESYQNYFN